MRRVRLRRLLEFAVIAMIFKALEYSPNGGLLDWATMYQAGASIMHGDLLGGTIIPGIPLLAEHAAFTQLITAPLSLLPPFPAFMLWWGIYYLVVGLAASRLDPNLPILLFILPPILLVPSPENYLWVILAPIGAALLIRRNDAWGLPIMLLGFMGIEYVGAYIAAALAVGSILNKILNGGEYTKEFPVLFSSALFLVFDAFFLSAARGYAHVPGQVFSTIIGNPLYTPLHLSPLTFLVLFSVLATAPVLPAFLNRDAWIPVMLIIAPLLVVSPVYSAPFTYYLAPFAVAGASLAVRVDRAWLLAAATILLAAATISIITPIQFVPLPSPATFPLMGIHSPPLHGVVLTNGFACGYLYINCTVASPVQLRDYPHSFAVGTLTTNLTNPTLAMNPSTPNPITAIMMNKTPLLWISPSVGVNQSLAPQQVMIGVEEGVVAQLAVAVLIGACLAMALYIATRRNAYGG